MNHAVNNELERAVEALTDHDLTEDEPVSDEEMEALSADFREGMIEQYIEGFKRMGGVVQGYRFLAATDEDLAEAIKRYEG